MIGFGCSWLIAASFASDVSAQEKFFAFCDSTTQSGQRVHSAIFSTAERRSSRPFREFLEAEGYVLSDDDTSNPCHYWVDGGTGTPTTSDREAVLRWVKDHVGERAIELDWPETGADGAGAQMQVSELEIDVALHGYFGGVTPRRLYTFRSDSEAERAVDRVVNATGLRRNFDVRAGGVDNAAAAIRNGRRLLLYNPAFMEEVERQTGSRWAGISVMAHEVGHHLQGHTITGRGSHPPIELEADEFS